VMERGNIDSGYFRFVEEGRALYVAFASFISPITQRHF
jgi:hypothetical protein